MDPQPESPERPRDSPDDFEHLGPDGSPKEGSGRREPAPIDTALAAPLITDGPPPELELAQGDAKAATRAFVERERGPEGAAEALERCSDSDDSGPEDPPKRAGSAEDLGRETFRDLEPEPPAKDYPPEPERVEERRPPEEEAAEPEVVLAAEPEVVLVCKKPAGKEDKTKKAAVIDAEAIFCKMGLDTWFNPERLNPKVESLIYWRDPKKSGPIFGGVLVILLALTYFSLISVVAYLSLLGLTGTISFRIYKNIVQAVQKTGDGHPFKEFLELDVSLPQDKVKEVSEVAVAHVNAAIVELRRLFLVEDLVDSIKFGVLLWTFTYLGAWFNGMTLIIIAWVALFTLPKVYEANKTQIDANLEIVRTKLAEITSKVKAAIPIGKKAVEEKKEQ